jgi:dihydrodipicolinate synthase/N-acetylneuraminate lyase
MFAPNEEMFDQETLLRLMDIPEIKGLKHSSLSRLVELDRLSLLDGHRPDFRIYTGNDLGINMIRVRLGLFARTRNLRARKICGERPALGAG